MSLRLIVIRGHDRAIGAWTRLCQSPVIDVGSLGLEEAEEPSAASNIYQAPRSSLLGDGSLSILPNPYYRSFNSEAINGGANSFKGRQALASLALIGSRNTKSTTYSNHMSTSNNEEEVWTRDKNYYSDSHRFPFVYLPERSAHGNDIIHYARNAAEARLVWGSSQEATAVLATMNFFHCLNRARDSGVSSVVCESGMCLLERWLSHAPPCRQRRAIATSRTSQKRRKVKQSEVSIASVASETFINQDQNSKTGTTGESFLFSSLEQRIWEQIKSWAEDGSLPLIGASPDGLIVHFSNNSSTAPSIEVLEVKCSSPFVNSEQHGMTISNYVWNQLNRETMQSTEEKQPCLPVWHIPQIQLEMLCAGPQCRSAVVCILSAVDARIYRVHRDDQVFPT